MDTVKDLLFERGQVVDQMRAIVNKAEGREMTAEETEQFNNLDEKQKELKGRSDTIHRVENVSKELEGVTAQPMRTGIETGQAKNVFAEESYINGFDAYTRRGKAALDGQFLNALQVGTDSEGGYIVPQEFETQIVAALQDINPFRQYCNVITTASDRNIPTEATLGSAAWTAEEADYNESDAAFGKVILGAHKATRIIKVSEELLQDAFFNVESYLAVNFGKSFGLLEEAAFVNGDGTAKPTGMVQGASAGVTAAAAAAITADELIELFHSLGRPYRGNARWVMNDATCLAVRKLKDADSQYLWQPGLQAGQPDMLLGREVIASTAMPTMASTAVSVLFGDLSNYTIADRSQRVMQRLNELYAANGQIGFRMHERVDGKTTLAAGIKKLTQAV